MDSRRRISSLLGLATLVMFAGCGGGTTFNVQNPPPPPTTSLAIAFKPVPPQSLVYTSTAPVTAVVTDDSSDAGVDWSLNCSHSGNCGSVSPTHTASGQATTYTPPPTLSSDNQSVSITAFAAADHTKNVATALTLSAFGSILQGTYVFASNGIDPAGRPFQRVGVITLDGAGGVVPDGNGHAGEQTVNFFDTSAHAASSVTVPIRSDSYYFVGQDGRGTLTIRTDDPRFGQPVGQVGVETYALVVLSNSHSLITKMDYLNDPQGRGNNESATGTLDLQTSAAAPSSGFAFVARGQQLGGPAIGLGGVLNIDSPGSISGAGSVFDLATSSNPGVVTRSTAVTGTVSAPDSFGAVQINLASDFSASAIQFTAYPVDSTHMQLIESDASSGSGFAETAGMAIGQGAATGTFTKVKSFLGTFVFGIFGQDSNRDANSLAAAGTIKASGNGTLPTGYLDVSQQQADPRDPNGASYVQVSDDFHGTYTVDPSGSGRVDTNSSIAFMHTKINGKGPRFIFYLTGSASPALVLDADVESNVALGVYGGGVGTGIAYPAATSGSSFAGSYGLSLTQNLLGTEVDAVGEISVDGVQQILSGVVDADASFVATPGSQGQPNLSDDGIQTTAIVQRLTDDWFTPWSSLSVAYYLIDSSHGFVVETDGASTGSISLGYFTTRTPVCQGCP